MPKYWSTMEISKVLNVSPNTVKYWIREKGLNGVKVGKVWRIAESDLIAFLNKSDMRNFIVYKGPFFNIEIVEEVITKALIEKFSAYHALTEIEAMIERMVKAQKDWQDTERARHKEEFDNWEGEVYILPIEPVNPNK